MQSPVAMQIEQFMDFLLRPWEVWEGRCAWSEAGNSVYNNSMKVTRLYFLYYQKID